MSAITVDYYRIRHRLSIRLSQRSAGIHLFPLFITARIVVTGVKEIDKKGSQEKVS